MATNIDSCTKRRLVIPLCILLFSVLILGLSVFADVRPAISLALTAAIIILGASLIYSIINALRPVTLPGDISIEPASESTLKALEDAERRLEELTAAMASAAEDTAEESEASPDSQWVQYLNSQAGLLSEAVGKLGRGELDAMPQRRVSSGDMKDIDAAFAKIENAFTDSAGTLRAYIDEINTALQSISEGNLQNRIGRSYPGVFDATKRSINAIMLQLTKTIEELTQASKDVSGGASLLSLSSDALSLGSERQMASIQVLSGELGDIAAQSGANSKNAKDAAELARASKNNAEVVNVDMVQLMDAMDKINDSSNKVSDVIRTINNIALQTNMLALNASVEASRAGEHGRGFLVVAEEVRTLAVRSSEAAQRTSVLIQESIDGISEGVKRANDTAASVNKIVHDVEEVSGAIEKIFDLSRAQTKSIRDVTDSLSQINNLIHDDVETSKEAAHAAYELDEQVDTLQKKLAFFQAKIVMAPSIRKIWKDASMTISFLDKIKNISGTHTTYDRGDIIINEGDPDADCMYFLVDGNVDVYKSYGKSNELLLSSLKPGDLFGEMALFLNEPRTATVVAQDKAIVMEVRQDNMNDFMDKHPDIARTMIETLCIRLKNALMDLGAL